MAQITLPFGTMRAGMQLSEGTVPDFVATNMDGSRRLGVHVLARPAGLDTTPSGAAGLAGLLCAGEARPALGLGPDSRALAVLSEGPAAP